MASLVGVAGCARRTPIAPPPMHRAFYYWRTTLRLLDVERRALADLAIDRLYVRAFDVDWPAADPAPRPLGLLASDANVVPASIAIVPVVFLRDRVLRRIDAAAVAPLADTVWRGIGNVMQRLGRTPGEVQLDCDWTDGTRERYFAFLTALGEHARAAKVLLSATIRLHQIKYRERTGVPPVERGMLMFYNMGRVDTDEATSAIYDPVAARAYLARVADYPVPLDVALPIWSWVVHVREGQVEGLLQDVEAARLMTEPGLRRVSAHRFEVTEARFLHGTLLREGDLLDADETTGATTRAAADAVAASLRGKKRPGAVALFHLSERNLTTHATPELDHVFASFQ